MSCAPRLDTIEVMQAVSVMLQGHWDLLVQFNAFLPAGYRIESLPTSLSTYKCCYNANQPNPGAAKALATAFVGRVAVRPARPQSALRASRPTTLLHRARGAGALCE